MSNPNPYAMANEAMQLYEEVRPFFAGRDPEVVGAVLAQALATLLAGHISSNSRKATEQLREDLLDQLIETVLKLIPPSEEELLERMVKPHE